MHILRIFRKSSPQFHSFERVFAQVGLPKGSTDTMQDWHLPEGKADPLSIWKNCRATASQKAGIYHITGLAHYLMLALPPKQTVLTIHDSVFLYRHKGLKRWVMKKLFLDWPVKRARIITTISQQSKSEIIQHTGCNPDKIRVIYNPVDKHIYYKPKEFNPEKPILLFIGVTPNKNLANTLKALSGIPCHLIMVGNFKGESLELLQQSGLSFEIRKNLSDQEMADAYADADIVSFASVYEGFGLPIIEGQKAGRAVLTSNVEPMKSVAGKGACLVNPHDVDSIKQGFLQLITNSDYRESLIKEGFTNVKQFEPEYIEQQYVEVYRYMSELANS